HRVLPRSEGHCRTHAENEGGGQDRTNLATLLCLVVGVVDRHDSLLWAICVPTRVACRPGPSTLPESGMGLPHDRISNFDRVGFCGLLLVCFPPVASDLPGSMLLTSRGIQAV